MKAEQRAGVQMMRAQCILFCAIFGLFLSGCGSIEVHQIFIRQPSMIEHRDIEVYVTGAPPHRPYYDIALIQAIGSGSDADVDHVTHAIANRAARLGCDAVVRLHVELGATRAHASAVCVHWAQATVVPATPAPLPVPPATAPPSAPPAPDDNGGTSI
jgi:hypothetical protein